MPIIFAQSIASLPATICGFMGIHQGQPGLRRRPDEGVRHRGPFYSILYFLLIVGFSYFYSTMAFKTP